MDPGHRATFCGGSIPFTFQRMAMDPGHQANFCGSSVPFTLQRMVMEPRHCANFCGSSIPLTPETISDADFRSNGVHLSKPEPKLLNLFPVIPSFRSSSGPYLQQTHEQHPRVAVAIRGASEVESLGGSALLAPSLLASECVPQNTVQIPLPSPQIPLPCLPPVDSVYIQSSTIPFVNLCKQVAAANPGQCLDGVEQSVSFNCRSNYQYNGPSNTPMLPFGASAAAVNKSPLSLNCTLSGHTMAGSLGPLTCPLVAQRTEELLLGLTCPLEGLTTNGHLSAHSGRNMRQSARHGPRPRSSIFRGVTYYKRTGRWEAHIWNEGKQIYLGASVTAEKAARAYDRAAIHYRTLSADLNFCPKTYRGELLKLMKISDSDLVEMLRKQSAGAGTELPEYPPGLGAGTELFPVYPPAGARTEFPVHPPGAGTEIPVSPPGAGFQYTHQGQSSRNPRNLTRTHRKLPKCK